MTARRIKIMMKTEELKLVAECDKTFPKSAPVKAPSTSNGKKMPPGTEEPKLIIEKINLLINKIKIKAIVKFPSVKLSTSECPPPKTSGNTNSKTPAIKKGMRGRYCFFSHVIES